MAWRRIEESEQHYYESCLTYGWFEAARGKRLIGEWGPSRVGVRYRLYELEPQPLDLPAARPDYCRLEHNLADTL